MLESLSKRSYMRRYGILYSFINYPFWGVSGKAAERVGGAALPTIRQFAKDGTQPAKKRDSRGMSLHSNCNKN
jgi:hypothetical protein